MATVEFEPRLVVVVGTFASLPGGGMICPTPGLRSPENEQVAELVGSNFPLS